MKIYTKTGDKGKTSLFGGKRVWKDNIRVKAYGDVDELNTVLGISITEIQNSKLKEVVKNLQHELFILGSDLASPIKKGKGKFIIPRICSENSKRLEILIDNFDGKIPPLKNFILPGGAKGASYIHHARSICRRAERDVISLSKLELINSEIIIYLNRLSDLLFVLARYDNLVSNHPEIEWKK